MLNSKISVFNFNGMKGNWATNIYTTEWFETLVSESYQLYEWTKLSKHNLSFNVKPFEWLDLKKI